MLTPKCIDSLTRKTRMRHSNISTLEISFTFENEVDEVIVEYLFDINRLSKFENYICFGLG